jgi:hypothetical protein
MRYPEAAALVRIAIPKLLGTYESELHPVLATIAHRKYDIVLDIGSAEGYYAVGLARLLRTPVLAFDPEPIERGYCRKAAELNKVEDLVELRDLFTPNSIAEFAGKRVLCICDCEGFEERIFNESTAQQVQDWDLLIELHDSAEMSLPRLPWPHRTMIIESEPRCSDKFAEIEGLGDAEKLLSEYRHNKQLWLWCDSHFSDVELPILENHPSPVAEDEDVC